MQTDHKGSLLNHKAMLVKGAMEFNRQDYFEAHDTFEEIWQHLSGFDKTFLHGLLNLTIGLHHFSFGRWKGAVSQFEKALNKWDYLIGSYKGFEVLETKKLIQNELLPLAKKCEENSITAAEFKESVGSFRFPTLKFPQWLSIETDNDESKAQTEFEMRIEEEKAELWLKLAEERMDKEKLRESNLLLQSKVMNLEKNISETLKKKKRWILASIVLTTIILLLFLKIIVQ